MPGRISRWLLPLIVVCLLHGGVAGAGEKKLVLGVCVMGLRHPYFRDMLDEMQKAANRAGVELVAGDADFDNARQVEIIEGYIARKVSLIMLAPFDAKGVLPVLEKAKRAGIPIMTVDAAAAPGFEVISHCASDNVAGGRLAGGLLLERMAERGARNSGDVLVLDHAGVTSTAQRVKGFRDVMGLRGTGYRVEVADAVGQTANAVEKTGAAIADKGERLVAMFCSNDGMTLGALQAVAAAKRKGVVIVGYDYVEEAKAAVDDGRLAGIVVQFPRRIGAAAFKIAHDYLTGKDRTPPREFLVEVGTYTRDGFLDQRGNPIDF